jgi:hypothetical protein
MKLILTFSLLLLVGCAPDWKARVESNTSWSGSFGGRTVDGHGNQTVGLGSGEVVCCVVQKNTTGGRLKVSIVDESTFGLGSGESNETTAQYGCVSVCSKSQ